MTDDITTPEALTERAIANERQRRWRAKPGSKEKETANRTRWREANRAKDYAAARRWKRNNPKQVRAQNRRRAIRQYGLTPEQYIEMFKTQGQRCAICCSETSGSHFDWSIDHCHTTGRIRGILCAHCNRIVHSLATPAILRRAAQYIESAP